MDHLLLVVQMDLWVQVGLVGPERKERLISDLFLGAMSMLVMKTQECKHLTICPTSPVSPFSPGGPGKPCGGGGDEFEL